MHTEHGYTHHDRQWAIPSSWRSPLCKPRKMMEKIILACRVELREWGAQKKYYFCACHSQSSVQCIRKFRFLPAQPTLLKSRDHLWSIILKNGKKLCKYQHEKSSGLLRVKNKLDTSISLFLVAQAYSTRQVLSRIPGQKAIFHFLSWYLISADFCCWVRGGIDAQLLRYWHWPHTCN